jgi:hypothetical protein
LGGVAAAYQNRDVDQQQGELDQQARDEAQKAMQGLPSMMGKRTVDQVVPGEEVPVDQPAPQSVPTSPYGTSESLPSAPGTMLPQARAQMTRTPDTIKQVQENYALSPEEYSQNLTSYLGTLDPTNPHLATVREHVLKQALDMPEKVMAQQQKSEDAMAIAKERFAEQQRAAAERYAFQREKLQSDEERHNLDREWKTAQHNSQMEFNRWMAQNFKIPAGKQIELAEKKISGKGFGLGDATVSPALARAVAEGRIPMIRLNSRTLPMYEGLVQENPDADFTKIAMDQVLGNNATFQGKNIGIQAMPEILNKVVESGKALDFPENMPMAYVKQKWLQLNKDPRYTEYMTLRNDSLLTIANTMRGVGMSDFATKLEEEVASPSMSPKQLEAWMRGQMKSLQPRLDAANKATHNTPVGGGSPVGTVKPGRTGTYVKIKPGPDTDKTTWGAQ